jgi:hypothetical protein
MSKGYTERTEEFIFIGLPGLDTLSGYPLFAA